MTDDRFKFVTLWVTVVGVCTWLISQGIVGWAKFISWIDMIIGKI